MPDYVADPDSVFHALADPGRRLMLVRRVLLQSANLGTGRCGFRREQVFLNLAEWGNCVAALILLAFAEAVTCGAIQRGGRVFLVGTGAGLRIGFCTFMYQQFSIAQPTNSAPFAGDILRLWHRGGNQHVQYRYYASSP